MNHQADYDMHTLPVVTTTSDVACEFYASVTIDFIP
mgnify:CR=1 FL=1